MSAAGEVTDIGVVQNDDDGPRPNQQIIDVILLTYIMKPEETELFYPSVVKKIADEVLLKFLDKQDFDEDESKTWILKISEEIKARVKSTWRRISSHRAAIDVCSLSLPFHLPLPHRRVQHPSVQGGGAGDIRADEGSGGAGGVAVPVGHVDGQLRLHQVPEPVALVLRHDLRPLLRIGTS